MEQIAGYMDECQRTELALRMIGHEARTCTIKFCTGLSDDRIRRLYARYFKDDAQAVKRQRGKSPSRTAIYVRNATFQCEATSLAMLLLASDVLSLASDGRFEDAERENPLKLGFSFCLAYETYRSLHRTPHFCFERAWGLYRALERGDELVLMACAACAGVYVHHVMEMDEGHCPCCRLKGVQRRRSAKSVQDLATRRRYAASRAQAG
ncbi:MAG: FlhC family transcriptional regulator [Pseudomonadota bacterium]